MLRIGIVGAGSIVEEFLHNAIGNTNIKISVLYSRTYEKAKVFGAKHNIPLVVKTYEELLDYCDIVYIASQNNFHFQYSYTALQNGKHVLCEKPMCVFGDDTKKLFTLAESKNLILMEAQRLWTVSIFQKIKSLLQENIIGDVLSFDASTGSIGQRLERRVPEYGGGALLDLGVYPLFVFLYLFGDIEEISAQSIRWETGVDAYTTMSVRYQNIIGHLSASFLIDTRGDLRICGAKGTLYVPKKFQFSKEVIIEKDGKQETIFCEQNEHDMFLMLNDFYDYIHGKNLEYYNHRKKISISMAKITDQIRDMIDLSYDNLR